MYTKHQNLKYVYIAMILLISLTCIPLTMIPWNFTTFSCLKLIHYMCFLQQTQCFCFHILFRNLNCHILTERFNFCLINISKVSRTQMYFPAKLSQIFGLKSISVQILRNIDIHNIKENFCQKLPKSIERYKRYLDIF